MDILDREPKIVITREKVSRKPVIEVEGLWTGKDRLIINTHLRKAIRKKAYEYIKARQQADILLKEAAIKNNIKEEKEQCPKAKTPKKKLLMKIKR